LRRSLDVLRRGSDAIWLGTNSAYLAEALHRQGRYDEAVAACDEALEVSPGGYLTARAVALRTKGKALARVGRIGEAEELARSTVEAIAATDAVDEHAESLLALAEVLVVVGAFEEARVRLDEACETFAQKGNLASAARAREALAELV
jgi:tetratricopeptide (TPR) repeat protein